MLKDTDEVELRGGVYSYSIDIEFFSSFLCNVSVCVLIIDSFCFEMKYDSISIVIELR